MNQDSIEIIGLIAGALTTLAYVPQVVKVWRSRSARDISLGMFLLMNCGIALWLIYGLLIGSPGLIAANLVTLGLTAAVLVAKLRFDRPDTPASEAAKI
ncbi:MAG: SemiSWEET transporter [Ferrovibrio sp.]